MHVHAEVLPKHVPGSDAIANRFDAGSDRALKFDSNQENVMEKAENPCNNQEGKNYLLNVKLRPEMLRPGRYKA
jgi:hypothetical protein